MKAVILFSGGLDSQLAMKLMLDQGVELHALHFTSAFTPHSERGEAGAGALRAAARFDVPITVQDVTEEMLELVRNPRHGHGSGLNPCIDCRIMQMRRARALMDEVGAGFVVTGEVLGQRPMSQRRDAMRLIEKAAGLAGLVLRPLSALALEPTVPEQEGWVDREKLRYFTGRQRTPQMHLAVELGVTDYPNPAGGCRLTEPGYTRRVRDLLEHGQLTPDNLRLLDVGRHFRLGPSAKLVVGRNQAENERIERLVRESDNVLEARDFPGPIALARGDFDDALLRGAARITARYGKGRSEPQLVVQIRGHHCGEIRVDPATDPELEAWRV